MAHDDLKLAARCRTGEPGAFDEVYRANAPRLFGLICRLVGRNEAEDLLQDAFLSAHRKLMQYKGDSALSTWLFRMTTNLCIDYLRSRSGRWAQITDEIAPEMPSSRSASGPVLGVIDRLDLDRALATLPPGARTVFVLHDVEGFEHREIARMLGVSDGTSKSQLHRARFRLRDALATHRATADVAQSVAVDTARGATSDASHGTASDAARGAASEERTA